MNGKWAIIYIDKSLNKISVKLLPTAQVETKPLDNDSCQLPKTG